jgi:uncharacterized damage-inducible protein DinB
VSASPPDFAIYTDFESLKKYMFEVHAQSEAYLARLSPEVLNRQIDVPWGRAPSTKVSVEAWLTMLIPEDLIHYGELSAALRQMGQAAPYMGYWRFMSKPRSAVF